MRAFPPVPDGTDVDQVPRPSLADRAHQLLAVSNDRAVEGDHDVPRPQSRPLRRPGLQNRAESDADAGRHTGDRPVRGSKVTRTDAHDREAGFAQVDTALPDRAEILQSLVPGGDVLRIGVGDTNSGLRAR